MAERRMAWAVTTTASRWTRLGALMLAAWLSGCQGTAPGESGGQAASQDGHVADMQSILDAQRARQALPGRAHYERACAMCHEGQVAKAPHREMLSLMTPEAILGSMTGGLMRTQASALEDGERQQLAEYLGGRALAAQTAADLPRCTDGQALDRSVPLAAVNWGLTPDNRRALPALAASRASALALDTDWAVAFPGANRVRSQPLVYGGVLYVGSHGGAVYALDAASGCQIWRYDAGAEVRTGFAVSASEPGGPSPTLYFGDVVGMAYGIDAATGAARFQTRVDDHPNATVTGTPSLWENLLYVPVSALEVSLAVDPTYPCCTFRGSVVALDAATGEIRWKTHTIPEVPTQQSVNSAGTPMYGPSGAVIWNSPAIDAARGQLYVGTGENMSSPGTSTSDAIFAMDLASGAVRWFWQATQNDVWNTACDTDSPASCPPENGPDFDFGAAVILAPGNDGRDRVLAGQKSGMVHALDPDTGAVLWQSRVGRGGIQGGVHFGMAAAAGRVFVPVTDMNDGREYAHPPKPGVHALDISTGEPLWYAGWPDACAGRAYCHPGVSQAITVAGGQVYAGGMDGLVRGYDVDSGELVFELDTTQPFPVLGGGTSQGGSLGGGAGPIAAGGRLYLSSGYGLYNHMPGNLLLALKAR